MPANPHAVEGAVGMPLVGATGGREVVLIHLVVAGVQVDDQKLARVLRFDARPALFFVDSPTSRGDLLVSERLDAHTVLRVISNISSSLERECPMTILRRAGLRPLYHAFRWPARPSPNAEQAQQLLGG